MRGFTGTWRRGVVLSGALVASAILPSAEPNASPPLSVASSVSTPGVLEVHVVDHRGKPVEVRVTGCRDDVYPAARIRLETGRSCTVQARRRDGAFWTPWTAPVTATTGHLAVDLPDFTMGGLGVRIEGRSGGALVESVRIGTPGRDVGLETGDLITRADGVVLAGLSADAMVKVITGEAGTAVELEIIDVRTGNKVVRTGYRAPVD